jgi:hypothetical protein
MVTNPNPMSIVTLLNRNNIKMDLGEIGCGGIDWIGLAQDRDKWRALVNAVFGFHKMLESSRVSAQPVASSVVLSSTALVTQRIWQPHWNS